MLAILELLIKELVTNPAALAKLVALAEACLQMIRLLEARGSDNLSQHEKDIANALQYTKNTADPTLLANALRKFASDTGSVRLPDGSQDGQ